MGSQVPFYFLVKMGKQFLPVELVVSQAKPGDIIEFDRGLYIHYAIYSGNQKVIHYAPHLSEEEAKRLHFASGNVELFAALFCQMEFKAVCREEHIREVANLDYVRINNQEIEAQKRGVAKRSNVEALKIARLKLEERMVKYHFLRHNCEIMATGCRYVSEGWSKQSEEMGKSILNGLTIIIKKIIHFMERNQKELSMLCGLVGNHFVNPYLQEPMK